MLPMWIGMGGTAPRLSQISQNGIANLLSNLATLMWYGPAPIAACKAGHAQSEGHAILRRLIVWYRHAATLLNIYSLAAGSLKTLTQDY